MALGKLVSLVGFAVGLAALILQFSLTVPLRMGNGDTLPGALIYFFSFYTILTNIVLVLIYLSGLAAWRWLDWFRSPVARGMMAGVMTLVMGFYHFFLAATWDPQGLFKLCDVALHYVTPILYLVWWGAFAAHRNLSWRTLPAMLAPTLAYFAYALVRGAIVGEYPYPVLEANKLGYVQVGLNAVYLLATLTALFAIVIVLDQRLPRQVTKNG